MKPTAERAADSRIMKDSEFNFEEFKKMFAYAADEMYDACVEFTDPILDAESFEDIKSHIHKWGDSIADAMGIDNETDELESEVEDLKIDVENLTEDLAEFRSRINPFETLDGEMKLDIICKYATDITSFELEELLKSFVKSKFQKVYPEILY